MVEKLRKNIAAPNATHPIDRHVGGKLKQRRLMLGLSQERLADLLSLTLQQVQKYERGLNRVSASRLFEIAEALKVKVAYFFEELPVSTKSAQGFAEEKQAILDDDITPILNDKNARETGELLRAYYRITDTKKRKRVLEFLREVSDEGNVR